jgi:predicted nucleic acid binding AN1-type Zn finger protein
MAKESKPKSYNLNLIFKNIFRRQMPNVQVTLTIIDNDFFPFPIEQEDISNKSGELHFHNLKKGNYLLTAKRKNVEIQRIIDLDQKNQEEVIILPTILGLLKITQRFSQNELEKEYENQRTDYQKCNFCGKKYQNSTDRFRCKYCDKCFCTKHRLPENHNCTGSPQTPKGGYRVVYSKKNHTIFGK